MQFVVICYSVHNRCVYSHDVFDSFDAAKNHMIHDAHNTYNEEICNQSYNVELESFEDRMRVSSCDGDYEWTWDILSIR